MGGPNLITWALKSRALSLARGIRDAAVRGSGCWAVLAAQGAHLGGFQGQEERGADNRLKGPHGGADHGECVGSIRQGPHFHLAGLRRLPRLLWEGRGHRSSWSRSPPQPGLHSRESAAAAEV